MKLLCLLLTLIFINIPHIKGNGIRIPLSIYEPRLYDNFNRSFYEDVQGFYGTISIGTPPQKINVLFSLNYDNIQVLSSFCNSSVCRDQNHRTYNHETSKTSHYEYDSDSEIWSPHSRDLLVTDTITIGNTPIQNVSFRTTIDTTYFDSKPYDGVVGLRRSSDFIEHCEKLGLKKKFSFYTNYPLDNNTSELMLCGEDKTKFRGNLQYLNPDVVPNFHEWGITIQSVLLHRNDENVSTVEFQDGYVMPEFGMSLIVGLKENIKDIYNKLNTKTSKIRDDLMEVDCKNIHTLPSITFKIDAVNNFTLTGNDYIKQAKLNDERVCIVPVLSSKNLHIWIIKSVFLRKFYTVFDSEMERIGIAESIHDRPAQIMVFLF